MPSQARIRFLQRLESIVEQRHRRCDGIMSAYLCSILLIAMATCSYLSVHAFRPQPLLRCRGGPAAPKVISCFQFLGFDDDNININTNTSVTKPAYIVIEAKLKESEMERFGQYASQVPALVARYGGEYLVLGGQHEPLEGNWDTTRIVLHRWPSVDEAKKFWNSDEYQELKKLREGTGEFRIMLLEGLDMSDIS